MPGTVLSTKQKQNRTNEVSSFCGAYGGANEIKV